jgi:hypothetical protein
MNRTTRTLVTAALAALLAGRLGHAAPLDLSTIPETVGYVAHLDVDKLASTEFWRRVEPTLMSKRRISAGIDMIERIGDIRVPEDVHDVTVFGSDYDGTGFVVVLRSAAKRERIEGMLSMIDSYQERELPGGRVVHTWTDHKDGDVERLAAFGPSGELLVSGDEALLTQALDVLEKKANAKSLAGQLPFESHKDDAVTVYLAGGGIGKAIGKNPDVAMFLKPVQRLWLTAREDGPSLVMHGQVVATDAKSGELLRNLAEGARAFVVLFSRTERAGERAQRGAEMLDTFKSSVDGAKIDFRWSAPSQMIEDAIQQKLDEGNR